MDQTSTQMESVPFDDHVVLLTSGTCSEKLEGVCEVTDSTVVLSSLCTCQRASQIWCRGKNKHCKAVVTPNSLMACHGMSLSCPGLGNSRCVAFTSRLKPLRRMSNLRHSSQSNSNSTVHCSAVAERHVKQLMSSVAKAAAAVACSTLLTVAGIFIMRQLTSACAICSQTVHRQIPLFCPGAHARLEGVNKPELLPDTFTTVIDVAGFLTPGEVGYFLGHGVLVQWITLLLDPACSHAHDAISLLTCGRRPA